MNDTSVTQQVLHTGLFLIVGASVVLAGWNEPLRYLFMKPEQIATEEHAIFAPSDDPQRPFASSLRGTALDRAPWRSLPDGTIIYSNDFDTRKMGPRTESERKENINRNR